MHPPSALTRVNLPARVALLAVLVDLLGPTAAAQPRHGGLSSWPNVVGDGEGGCSHRWRTTRAVPAYAQPNTSSRRVRTVEADRRIEPSDRTESVRVLRAYGRVRTRRAFTLQAITAGRQAGQYLTTTLTLPAGAVLQTMWYAGGEGSDFRYRGVEYRGDVLSERWMVREYPEYARDFEALSYPAVENWVRLAARGDRPAAWLNVDQRGVAEMEDQCE